MRFRNTVGLNYTTSHRTFKEAFYAFFGEVNERIRSNNAPVSQSFLNSCWIEDRHRFFPIYFHNIVVRAARAGWIRNRKLVKCHAPKTFKNAQQASSVGPSKTRLAPRTARGQVR